MRTMSLPDTLTTLLTVFASCFTQPTFRTFQALVAGFLAQPGPRTVTGMLVGAGLAGRRHHDLAYRFFYRHLLTSGRRDGKGGLAPKTVKNIHATLHPALAVAMRWGYVVRNVADAVDLPKVSAP
jgi:hypothetical protein